MFFRLHTSNSESEENQNETRNMTPKSVQVNSEAVQFIHTRALYIS